jgi:hypothetical protein
MLASFLILAETRQELALSTWDVPERARRLGVLVDAVAEVGRSPRPRSSRAAVFSFADEGEFARLLAGADLGDIDIQTVASHAPFGEQRRALERADGRHRADPNARPRAEA